MRVEVDGPVAAGGRVRVTVVETKDGIDEIELRLESFERASATPRIRSHDQRTAGPGETVELTVPTDAEPGWRAGGIGVGWQDSARTAGLLGTTARNEIQIDPTSVRPMDDARAAALGAAADAGARRAARTELPMLAIFVLMAVAIVGFGIYLMIAPPEDQTWVVGAVVTVVGLLFPLPSAFRYLRRVDALELKGCRLRPEGWTTRGGSITVDVETTDAVDVAVLCRIDRLARSRPAGEPGGAAFVESVLGEQRRHVAAGSHRMSFTIDPDLPPTYAGDELKVRHIVQATEPGAGRNNHRRTEASFVVA